MARTSKPKVPAVAEKEHRNQRKGVCVYSPKPGKWRAQILINGKRVTKVHNSEEAAEDWVARTQVAVLDHALTADKAKMTVTEYLTSWLKLKEHSLKPTIYPAYKLYVERDLIPSLGRYRLREMNSHLVSQFYLRLIEDGYGGRTVEYIDTVLGSAMGQAFKDGYVATEFMKGAIVPKYEKQEMLILSIEEIKRFLEAAKNHPHFEAMYVIAVKYGPRIAELLGLRWSDVSWEDNAIYIQRQMHRVNKRTFYSSTKTRAGRRKIVLGKNTMKVLRDHFERQQREMQTLKEAETLAKQNEKTCGKVWRDNNLVFPNTLGGEMDVRNFKRDFWKLLEEANIPRFRNVETTNEKGEKVVVTQIFRFHDLRHTAASQMLASKNPIDILVVSRILGHSRPSVTLNVYGHLMTSAQREAAEKIEENLNMEFDNEEDSDLDENLID